ncbi:phage replication initiation protein [Silvimonas terrae]|uniref:Phage replication initiation protein n=2 Tax=Silvimonas terrae TaxID=300266 RepID=A0A840RBJ7_9NEIS|nr:phage replication initiation protein [Silvimonas terrae]
MPRKRTQSPAVTPAQKIADARLTTEQLVQIDAKVARALSPENIERLDRLSDSEGRVRRLFGPAADAPAAAQAGQAEGAAIETPTDNMGVTTETEPPQTFKLVLTSGKGKGKLVEYPIRYGNAGDAAFVDWVTFTFHKSTCDVFGDFLQDDDDYALSMSLKLDAIFGYGITGKRHAGVQFFKNAWILGDNYGFVAIGGQQQHDRMMVQISGAGCAAAKPGWEQRLVNFLEDQAEQPALTRVDLAYDDFMGEEYTVDRALADFHAGLYQCYRGNAPEVQQLGNWINPSGKGRTFCVGQRTSGKFFRGYERGKKEGCESSPWFRAEVEFKNRGRVLPFDMLLAPGQYLAGAYPALAWVKNKQSRIETARKQAEISVQAAVKIFRHQFGKYVWTLRNVFGTEQFLKLVEIEAVPKRLKMPDYRLAPKPMTLADRWRMPNCDVNTGAPIWAEEIPFNAPATIAPWWIRASDGAQLS